ncbi:MAG: hypothetical protein ACRD50_11740 [Candidatus Acidiferrales bacterium]
MNRTISKKKNLTRFMAFSLALIAVLFVIETSAHFHANGMDDGICQVCHLAHIGPLQQFSSPVAAGTPVELGRVKPADSAKAGLQLFSRQHPSRAPPA